MTGSGKDVVRRFINEVINRHDLDKIDELCAPDHGLYHPALPEPVHGSDKLRIALTSFFESFPDLHFTIRDLVEDGDRVAMRFSIAGTNTGPIGGSPPTKRTIASSGMVLYRVRDGRIAEGRIQEDILRMLNQLGLVPQNLTLLQLLNRAGVIRALQRLGKIPTSAGLDFGPSEGVPQPQR
jgi:steroid delta-isomerase-like uncharacterized protein